MASRHIGGFEPFAFALGRKTKWPRPVSPLNDDSTLQPKAVLTVVVAADSQATVVAKGSVEILSLDEP
jgi:hypothetical protein